MSGKIYNHLVKHCSDEAFGIVRSVESGDGVEAWVKLHQKYIQRPMSRMMRVLMECMYPKEVKGSELVQAILQWEMKWNQMMKDQTGGTNIPELCIMAALMKMCPKEIKHNIAIDEKCSLMREKVVMWATNAAAKEGGAVLMDVGIVEGGGCEEDEGEECHEYEWVYAVYPTTRCYFCQGYGHMARECPAKSKWKGGVLRRKLDKKPKLAAANGTKIEVYGEAVLDFEENGKQCGMRFLDSDVKMPLAAVSAMKDEGNTVVFSKKWGNDATGEKIMIERVGDTFEKTLQAKKMKDGTRKEVRWAEDGGKKYEGMDVDSNDEDEDMLKEMTSGKSGSVVFRRQMS